VSRRPLRLLAAEGPCFAGKSSLIAALVHQAAATAVPEYTDLAPMPRFPPRDRNAVARDLTQLRDLDISRTALARQSAGPVVLDRSPLSCVVFQYAMRPLAPPCDHRLAVSTFTSAAQQGLIVLPEAYLYLRLDPAGILARQRSRGPVPPCLTDPVAIARMDYAYRHFLNQLPASSRLILDGRRPLIDLTADATAFIAALQAKPPAPAPELACLADIPDPGPAGPERWDSKPQPAADHPGRGHLGTPTTARRNP
jgi:hypothetical protein